jgi:hypothetical protein
MSDKPETNSQFWVNGIVARRDKMPYVQFSSERGMIAQVTMAQARNIAMDILQMCARTESDAMVIKFFEKEEFSEGAAAALMQEFRNFRHTLDSEEIERSEKEPS